MKNQPWWKDLKSLFQENATTFFWLFALILLSSQYVSIKHMILSFWMKFH